MSLRAKFLVCSDEWEFRGTGSRKNYCYKHFGLAAEGGKNWSEAREHCQKEAPQNNVGDLASVPDVKINKLLKRISEEPILWIGGYKKTKDPETWAWSDDTPWSSTWDSWAEGMPNNNGGKQNYMVTNFGDAGKWDDDDEEQRRGFICQYRREFTG